MSNYNQAFHDDWMSVDATTEPYQPYVPHSYDNENDFGFGNMQVPEEENYDNEPPLLEELGIDFSHIFKKIMVVINPRKAIDSVLVNDADLTGPIIFCFVLALLLLLKGRVQFGYTYGYFFTGCTLMFVIIQFHSFFDSSSSPISLTSITSILGYSIIPIVFVAVISVFFSINNAVGYIIGILAILWSSFSASRFIELLLGSQDQRYIIMYPLVLLYATFALITVF